jgi:1-acyl-sn-glycerol-3-phosphate acyltransferase
MSVNGLVRAGRAARLALHIVYALGLVVLILIPARLTGQVRARRIRDRLVRHWCVGLTRRLGLRIAIEGTPAPGQVLRVANHISWLDIVALNAVAPSLFVAKAEVAGWPLIGWMAGWLGTLFLRRGDLHSSQRLIEAMGWQLRRGEALTLFPEGTTGDGESLGKFHARLYQPALLTRAPVQPVAIAYPHPLGDRLTHPLAPFVGEQTLTAHVWALLGARDLVVRIAFLPPLSSTETRRQRLVGQSREAIASRLGLMAEMAKTKIAG